MFVNSVYIWYNKNMDKNMFKSIITNFHMVDDMCIPCSTIWYGVQNIGKRF